jgi:hypothetical protein
MKNIFIFSFMIACGAQIGPSGPAGKNGSNGINGTNGKDGSNATAAFTGSAHCGGALENTYLQFTYSVDVDGSGNIFATAGVYGNVAEYGASANYAATQNGAQTAAVIFTYDIVPPADYGFWTISLDRETLITTILYQDVDNTTGQSVWTMQRNQCVINAY